MVRTTSSNNASGLSSSLVRLIRKMGLAPCVICLLTILEIALDLFVKLCEKIDAIPRVAPGDPGYREWCYRERFWDDWFV